MMNRISSRMPDFASSYFIRPNTKLDWVQTWKNQQLLQNKKPLSSIRFLINFLKSVIIRLLSVEKDKTPKGFSHPILDFEKNMIRVQTSYRGMLVITLFRWAPRDSPIHSKRTKNKCSTSKCENKRKTILVIVSNDVKKCFAFPTVINFHIDES